MALHNELGKAGEDKAVEYLKSFGYEILERNYRAGHLELDIIAKQRNLLVFVEVKTRTREGQYTALGAINRAKCLAMIYAARYYAEQNHLENPVRFDIITVVGTSPENFVVKHYAQAFNHFKFLHQEKRRRARNFDYSF